MPQNYERALAAIIMIGAICGCAVDYKPNVALVSQKMSFDDALATLNNCNCSGEITGMDEFVPFKGLVADDGGFSYVMGNGSAKRIQILDFDASPFNQYVLFHLAGDENLWFNFQDQPSVTRYADAFAVVRQGLPMLKQQHAAAFDEAVKSYREAAVKPMPGEDVRRYKVQAEAAVREKRFADAADLYGKALEIAPWWPEGRFNRALVLSEVGRFSEALAEMRRYLELVPDASNARLAQDKIYEWEAKAPAPAQPVPPAAPASGQGLFKP